MKILPLSPFVTRGNIETTGFREKSQASRIIGEVYRCRVNNEMQYVHTPVDVAGFTGWHASREGG